MCFEKIDCIVKIVLVMLYIKLSRFCPLIPPSLSRFLSSGYSPVFFSFGKRFIVLVHCMVVIAKRMSMVVFHPGLSLTDNAIALLLLLMPHRFLSIAVARRA